MLIYLSFGHCALASVYPLLDAARLLHDLQKVHGIAQSLSGNLDPNAVARQMTVSLVEQFDCAFARIWLVEPDGANLRLVASSGLYTHIDGSFARVPMGAYKVGKIAQNQVPFLSNQLADERWVKDRQWALDNHIQGFVGYPLVARQRVLGVLAAFSHQPFAPEFLEVMQVICMTLSVALDAALQASQGDRSAIATAIAPQPLSDRIAAILGSTRPLLVGTEQPLPMSLAYGFLRTAELLQRLRCSYCRLTYDPSSVTLEAIVSQSPYQSGGCGQVGGGEPLLFDDLQQFTAYLGGSLQAKPVISGQAWQIALALPVVRGDLTLSVQVQCRYGVLQQAFTQLARRAGLSLKEPAAVRITDSTVLAAGPPTLWIQQPGRPQPTGVAATVDLNVTAAELLTQVKGIVHGSFISSGDAPLLSSREQQVMQLLAEGKRDRDIAQALYISESTVKFHINNSLAKLKAKNRYQGVYQATLRGWI